MMWLKFLLSAAVLIGRPRNWQIWRRDRDAHPLERHVHRAGAVGGSHFAAGDVHLDQFINQNTPDLAAGNLLGSNTVNMFLLAVIDLMHRKQRILRKAAMKHALTGSLAVFLIGLVVFFILADIRLQIGWVGVDSLVLIGAYLIAVRLIQNNAAGESHVIEEEEIPEGTPSLLTGVLGFLAAAVVLAVDTPV